MRFYAMKYVLLAVISNMASAGLVRYHDRPIRGAHYVRSFNQSSLAAAPSSQPAEFTTKTSATSSSLTTAAARSPTPSTATSISKQIGSVPAVGSGPGAATIDLESFTRISSSATLAPVGSSLGAVASSTLTTSNTQQDQSTSGATSLSPVSSASSTSPLASPETTLATRLSLGTGVATPASPPLRSQIQPTSSTNVAQPSTAGSQTTTSRTEQQSQDSAQTSAPSPSSRSAASSNQAGLPSVSNTPATSGGNLAQALDLNNFFKTLTADSSCSSGDKTQGHACINGLFATCSTAGHYLTFACDQGQQCFALPRPEPELGVFIQCDTPSDASRKLQGANPNISQTSSPKATATSTFDATTSSTVPSSISPVSTAISQGLGPKTTTQHVGSSTTQLASPTIETSSVTQPAPSATNSAASPDPAPSASTRSSVSKATSSTDVPLIISFPSSSSSSSQPSGQPLKPAESQDPVPASAVTSVASSESLVQPSPTAQPPTSTPTTVAATTSAAPPGITIVPLGGISANNKEKNEKTVTVTVTTTDRG
ncbi:MAG: hypothetical protein Q9202_000150 [Teloschistes flavicans]